jgi:hypothetical protein
VLLDALDPLGERRKQRLDNRPQMKRILRGCMRSAEDSMNDLATIVGFVGGECKGESQEQDAWREAPVPSAEIKGKIRGRVKAIFELVERGDDRRGLDEVERGLVPLIFGLARLFLAYFLARREEHSASLLERWQRKGYRSRKPERKYLGTLFGQVCFWRTYVRQPQGQGLHPLDHALGLTADGFSSWVLEMCARLSTLVSYEQVTALLLYFLSWSPSKTTVEKAVLGLGRYTQEWFYAAPPPEGDGEVLVIQFDSKATPTATEEELAKRRGKRQKERPLSPRHRGRAKRARRGPKMRRRPGDKSKNGKAATIVAMYTLKADKDKDGNRVLLGPINKKVYASYAPKRHAFALARRDANKRGFHQGSAKTTQIVTDGDEDLESLVKEFFPEAKHTLDIVHVLEYVWEAGRLLFKEGSAELTAWVKKQESLLYRGKAVLVVQHLCDARSKVAARDRERLQKIRDYLAKRLRLMDYHELREQDLEVASGAVEGAVRHVIAKRFDSGSMRWIKERAEALLQLRSIEINGDWQAFMLFVKRRLREKGRRGASVQRLLTTKPAPLPTFGLGSISADKICA